MKNTHTDTSKEKENITIDKYLLLLTGCQKNSGIVGGSHGRT